MNRKTFIISIVSSVLVSVVVTAVLFNYLSGKTQKRLNSRESDDTIGVQVSNNMQSPLIVSNPDFTIAVNKSVDAVVHVKTSYMQATYPSLFDYFFGGGYSIQQTPVMASGSGVIISNDGYIVTNNHVIDGSEYIEVVLNDQRSFEAKLVGTDPYTDIALLKIDAKDLPFITFGDSDGIKVGEWVLAVGNPFNLTSTVTAGIISAKARNINILSKYSIESFIQFDAAVNPGNSGGALVNVNGDLIGINTAIASKTGSFVGYSFAIPSNIVRKIVSDLIEYGTVQRAYLGVSIVDLNSDVAKQLGIDETVGIYVNDVYDNSGAKEAGIKPGDIIESFGGYHTKTTPQLHEQLSKYRPGDKVEIKVKRDGKIKTFSVELRNQYGTTEVIKDEAISTLGATIASLSPEDKQRLRLKYGVKIVSLDDGLLKKAGIKKGFIIQKINNTPVYTPMDVKSILENYSGNIIIEGYYPNGIAVYYTFTK